MNATFVYTGKLNRNIDITKIEILLKEAIANQQKQFQPGVTAGNIEIVDYAYVEAEPNCLFVFANWKLI